MMRRSSSGTDHLPIISHAECYEQTLPVPGAREAVILTGD